MYSAAIISVLALASTSTSTAVEGEELVDFAEEEKRAQKADEKIKGQSSSNSDFGLKFFVDLLVDYTIGEKKFEFRPNHTYVFVQLSVYDDLQFMMHISDAPIFYEITWNATPRLSFTAGKLLIPFGTNEFHHIIGGRVDELSNFLPETWGDYGLGLHHSLYDSEHFAAEYSIYAVNGFSGVDRPVIAEGSLSDNNWWKAIGTRARFTFLRKIKVTTSTYWDAWDTENDQHVLFYAVGAELNTGLFDVPILRDLRLRGEWGRGEIQIPGRNYQRGILEYAYARTGYYAELQYNVRENLAFRVRAGRINPDNTLTDDGDIEVYEPAILVGLGKKIWFTFAYQFIARPVLEYSPTEPPDLVYAKVFLTY